MTPTQAWFIEWNAERLGIPVEESRRRFERSWRAVPGGHGGRAYREFNVLAHELMSVFGDDRENEIYEAYAMHAPVHFLRMLSHKEPAWSDRVIDALSVRSDATILDFGCGLAHRGRSLAERLIRRGLSVHLVLADIPTMRKEFLIWMARRAPVPVTFLDCTRERPIPDLPPVDACIATEFFEHVHDPLRYFERFHAALRPGGLLIAALGDHDAEFMHVSPNLAGVRRRVAGLGYTEVEPGRAWRRPS